MLDLKNVIIKEKKVDTVLTKSNLPIAGYSINTYVGCPFACKYCYATFMKRFTGHKEDWGTFLDKNQITDFEIHYLNESTEGQTLKIYKKEREQEIEFLIKEKDNNKEIARAVLKYKERNN